MKLIGVGRNYINHAKELNNPVPTEPVVFLMPDSALLRNNEPFYYPDYSENIHYEVELVIKISKVGKCIDAKFAHRYYEEIALGIDFTARDLQDKYKKKGLPWALAKGFDNSAVISPFFKKENYDLSKLKFSLNLNRENVQTANTTDMIFSIDKIIEYVSNFMTLKIGDLIYTGTPEGVGPVKIGDNLQAFLEEEKVLDFDIK